MNSIFRKVGVAIIVISLCTLQTVNFGYASENVCQSIELVDLCNKNTLVEYSENREKIENEIEIMKDSGLLDQGKLKDIVINESDDSYSIGYIVEFGEITNIIEIIDNCSDKTTFRFIQDDILNEITKTADGRIYLDGNEVEYDWIEKDLAIEDSNTISPHATETWFQTRCPYGSLTDYSNLKDTRKYGSIAIKAGKALEDLSYAAFVYLLVSATGLSGAAGFATEYVFNKLLQRSPKTTALSIKIMIYTHSSYKNGFVSPISTWVWKYCYFYYGTSNFSGIAETSFDYKCQI